MKRRRFLSSMAIMLPMAVVSTEVFLSSCNATDSKEEGFTEDNIKLLDEIGETIIPATSSSPGAKAARIGEFMKVYVTDCYSTDQKNIFWNGIRKLKDVTSKKYNKDFTKLSNAQKEAVLKSFENESINAKNDQTKGAENKENANSGKFFSMIQNLTVFGYFTSEPGATKALRYIQTPGSYKGEVPYKKGDKAWAT